MKTYKGIFKPKNPLKYKGDVKNIVYRSSWELRLMRYFDEHKEVTQWASEEVAIPYISPLDGRIHRYFPDFIIVKINNNRKHVIMIEVKPATQTTEPKKQKKITKAYINEVRTWGINRAKWDAAERYCKERGWVFQIMTEKHIFGK